MGVVVVFFFLFLNIYLKTLKVHINTTTNNCINNKQQNTYEKITKKKITKKNTE